MNDDPNRGAILAPAPRPAKSRAALAAVIVLAVGWAADHWRQDRELARAEQDSLRQITKAEQTFAARERIIVSGADAALMQQLTEAGVEVYVRPCGARILESSCCDSSLEKLAGLPSLDAVSIPVCGMTALAATNLQKLPQLKSVHVQGGWVTGEVLQQLVRLEQLESLAIDDATIYDENLTALEALPNLTYLRLHNSPITSAGLKHLQRMKRLRELCLSRSPISDRGIAALSSLTSLRTLDLRGAQITPEGFVELEKQLPNCKVLHDATDQ